MYSRERIDWEVVLMGLFNIFKNKKDEKSDVVDSNGQVQVQPEGIQQSDT